MEACLNRVDIGIASLLTGWEDNDDVNNLRERVIEAFCNMRGKDYVRKRRALAGFNFQETHGSTIGTLSKQAKNKAKGRRRKRNITPSYLTMRSMLTQCSVLNSGLN